MLNVLIEKCLTYVVGWNVINTKRNPEKSSDWYGTLGYPQTFLAIHKIVTILLTTPVGSIICERSFSAVRRVTWLQGFRVKIANFSRLHCIVILRRDLNTKKTKPNMEKWPESVGVVLEFNISNLGYCGIGSSPSGRIKDRTRETAEIEPIVEPFCNKWGSFECTWPRDAPRFLIQRGTEHIPESEAIYIIHLMSDPEGDS